MGEVSDISSVREGFGGSCLFCFYGCFACIYVSAPTYVSGTSGGQRTPLARVSPLPSCDFQTQASSLSDR